MPKRQQLILECDYCGYSETVTPEANPNKAMEKLNKWFGVVRATDPAGQGMPDMTRWYDSVQCVAAGLKKEDETRSLEEKLAKAAQPDHKLTPLADELGAVRT
jgi:hypothetical protein